MERPKIEDFFPKDHTTERLNDFFLQNKGIYNYIQSLDNYIDELESKTSGMTIQEAIKSGKPFKRPYMELFHHIDDGDIWETHALYKLRVTYNAEDLLAQDWQIKEGECG